MGVGEQKKVDKAHLDQSVNSYVTQLYSHGLELSTASYLVYGLQLLECDVAKEDFCSSVQTEPGWMAQGGPRWNAPSATRGIFVGCCNLGPWAGRLVIAVAIAIQYHGYVRPSECLTLTSQQIGRPQGRRYPHWSLVIAPSSLHQTTKTGKADDTVLLGDLPHNIWMKDVMQCWMLRHEGPLFPNLTLFVHENWMKQTCYDLGYTAECLKPHVIRHSAASNDRYHKRRSLHEVGKRGRWEAKSSISRYETHALLLTQWKNCAPARRSLVSRRS